MIIRGVTVALLLGLTAPAVMAHSGAKGVVKERMEAMKEMKQGTKVLAAMAKGEAPLDAGLAQAKADRIADLLRAMPERFPEGSATGKSEAKDAIWSDWDDFVARTEESALEADAVAAASDQGQGAFARAVADMARTCKGCHDTYRAED